MNKRTIWTIVVVVIVVGLAAILFSLPKREGPVVGPEVPEGAPEALPETPEVPAKTPEVPAGTPEAPEVEFEKFKKAEEIVPGASPVTREGEVLTEEGEPVNPAGVVPGAPEAPKQSEPIEKEELPESVLKLEVSCEKGFVPQVFRVRPGQVVSISLTAVDDQNHAIAFTDRILRGVSINVRGGETRAITFKAPDTPGEYAFVCPYHTDEETGKMFVAE